MKGSKLPVCFFYRTFTPMIIEFLSKVINKSEQSNRRFSSGILNEPDFHAVHATK